MHDAIGDNGGVVTNGAAAGLLWSGGGREGGKEGGREGGREAGREGGREEKKKGKREKKGGKIKCKETV